MCVFHKYCMSGVLTQTLYEFMIWFQPWEIHETLSILGKDEVLLYNPLHYFQTRWWNCHTRMVFHQFWLSSSLQYWHKGCFSCEVCKMALSMTTYKGFEKKPYCGMWVFTHGWPARLRWLKQSRLIPTLTEQAGWRCGSEYLRIYDCGTSFPCCWKRRNVLPLHFHPSGNSFKSHANSSYSNVWKVSIRLYTQTSLWRTDCWPAATGFCGSGRCGWRFLLFMA